MDTYYVASPIRHALVSAENEADAWVAGHQTLHRLHAEHMDRTGEDIPVEINDVRLATTEEVAIWMSLHETLV